MRKTIALLFILAFAVQSLAQETSLAEIIDRASARRTAYVNEFANLLSRETKSFEIFDKRGSVKRRRKVESTFLVYRLSKDERRTAEFRNVITVDGQPVADAEKRAGELFESIAKLESSEKELEKVQEES